MKNHLFKSIISLFLLIPLVATAELPWQHDEHTRYLALGDSLTAGYGADPASNGYAYILYQQGVFDTAVRTLYANASVPGVTSADVLAYQVPQVSRFKPDVITMTFGGNDLLKILEENADPVEVITQYGNNLFMVLGNLCAQTPQPHIFIGNLYDVPLPDERVPVAIAYFNQTVSNVVGFASFLFSPCQIRVADVHAAFDGRSGLLSIERHGAKWDEIHPTNAGYRAMAEAFKQVIQQ